jgi:hypothetical protein
MGHTSTLPSFSAAASGDSCIPMGTRPVDDYFSKFPLKDCKLVIYLTLLKPSRTSNLTVCCQTGTTIIYRKLNSFTIDQHA